MTVSERIKAVITSDWFPILIACILFVTPLMDIGMTNYIYRKDPNMFYKYEGNPIARRFFVSEMWWISYLGYSLFSSFILVLSALASDKSRICLLREGRVSIRISCLTGSFLPLMFALAWTTYL